MSITVIEAGRVHTATGAFGGAATAATNATPVVVTFSAAHNLIDGDQVQGSGFATNTAANALLYAKRTGYSATTIGLYSDPLLATPLAGNGATSTGAVSIATDISGMTGDLTVFITALSETAAKGCLVHIQDSADGFVADIRTIGVLDIYGSYPAGGVVKSWRKYEMPQARFGVASATMRLYVSEIDGSNSVTLSLSIG